MIPVYFFESPELAVYYVFVLFFAYLVRGIAGFGSALLAVPLLTVKLEFIVVVPVIAVLDYLASVGQGLKDRHSVSFPDLWPLFPFTLCGVVLGVYLLSSLETRVMALCLAGFVMCFALYSLLPLKEQRGGRKWAVPAGFMGGLVGAIFGKMVSVILFGSGVALLCKHFKTSASGFFSAESEVSRLCT